LFAYALMQRMAVPRHALLSSALAALAALGASACGTTVSTSSFSGEQHEVAQAIANFQSDASGGDEKKVCNNDLAGALVARLNSASGGCRQVLKDQLTEVESYDLTVDAVDVTAAGHAATARVRSIYGGKTRAATLSLVKEGGKWKLAGIA
jgi:hypothetical protein